MEKSDSHPHQHPPPVQLLSGLKSLSPKAVSPQHGRPEQRTEPSNMGISVLCAIVCGTTDWSVIKSPASLQNKSQEIVFQ